MPHDNHPAPPFYPLTETDHAALAVITSLIFLIYAIVGIALKLIIRLNITSLKSHDVILLVSTVFLFIQTICTIVACNRGLGRHQSSIDPHSLEAIYKLFYVSSILALAVAAGTKISLCLLIHSINNHGRLNIATKVLFGVIVAWAISGIFAVAFQCSIPRPWAALSLEECPNREAIFLYNGIMDILTDVALCVLPVAMMWKVQTSVHRKLLVTALFGTRIVVPILSVPGLVSTHHLVSDYSDSTWTAISHVVWLQVTLGLSVLTACVPSLKGVIDSLLGSTAVAAIQAPYQLASSGKASRLHATNLIGSGSQKRPGSHLASGLGNSRTAETRSLRKPDWPEARRSHEILEKEDAGCSDSIRKLTDSGEFETHSDGRRRSSSQEGSMSMKSSETGYRL